MDIWLTDGSDYSELRILSLRSHHLQYYDKLQAYRGEFGINLRRLIRRRHLNNYKARRSRSSRAIVTVYSRGDDFKLRNRHVASLHWDVRL